MATERNLQLASGLRW